MIPLHDMIDWLRAEPADAPVIQSLIEAAVEHVENETGQSYRGAGQRSEVLIWTGWPASLATAPTEGEPFALEMSGPGGWVPIDPSRYSVEGARVWPVGRWGVSGPLRLRATYTGEPSAPDPVQLAVKLLVGHWYENREAVVIDRGSAPHTVPMAVDRLLAAYRKVAL